MSIASNDKVATKRTTEEALSNSNKQQGQQPVEAATEIMAKEEINTDQIYDDDGMKLWVQFFKRQPAAKIPAPARAANMVSLKTRSTP
jgi:hypothetical protein